MRNRLLENAVDLDFADPDERDRIKLGLLDRLFHHAVRHPSESERLESAKVGELANNSVTELWERIPIRDTEDHRHQMVHRRSQIGRLSSDRGTQIVFSSGGTSSGVPKLTWLSFDEVIANSHYHGKGYWTAGIRPDDVVITFGLPGLLSSEFTVYHGLEQTGCVILPVGDATQVDRIIELSLQLEPTCFLVMPSDLMPIVAELDRRGLKLPFVRRIVTGGEPIYESQISKIRDAFGNPDLAFRSTFQSSDTGTIGFQCDSLQEGEYHIHEELQHVEIIDGKLIVTNLNRLLMPVIRLETGDLAEWVPVANSSGRCKCGRTARVIRFLGRTSHSVKIGGEKLDVRTLIDFMGRLGVAPDQFAFSVILSPDGRDQIEIAVAERHLGRVTIDGLLSDLDERSSKLSAQLRYGAVAMPVIRALRGEDLQYSDTGKRRIWMDRRNRG